MDPAHHPPPGAERAPGITARRVAPHAGLRVRLARVLLVALVPVLLFLLLDGLLVQQRVRAEADAELLRMSNMVADAYGQQLDEAQRVLAAAAMFPEVQSGDADACTARLAALMAAYRPQFWGFGVADRSGVMFCASQPVTTTIPVTDRLWFQEALRTGEFAIGEYSTARPSGLPVLGVGYPVRNASGEVVRVVAHSLMLANLQAEADELPLPDDMVLTITDRNGSILVRTPDGERWVGQQHTDMVLQEIATTGTGVVEAIGVDGVPRLYATVPVRGPSGAEVWLSVGRTPEVLYAGVGQAVTRNIAGLGAILLVALAALWIGSDRLLLRRIDGLVDASTRLAAGEWEARAPASAQGDELDRLSSTFNAMADTLVQRQQELIDREQGLQAAWERAELAAARIARLQEVTADLAAALTPTEVTEVVLRKGAAALQAVAMSLKLISEDGEWLESGDVFDFPETIRGPYQRYPLNAQTPVAEAVRTGEAIWLRSEQEFIARYPHLAQDVKALAFEAAAALPLKLGDRTVGALGISFRTELAFDGEEREYLLTLASQCAQALERTRLYAWEQQARMDLEMRVSERTAELERSNRELNQFAYVASHDLKAPLRAIDNLAGWISEDAAQTLPPRSAEHLLKMRGRVKRMEQLLEDLLAYSRAGRVRPPAEIVDVERLVADVTALLGPPVGFTVIVQTPGVRLRTPRVSLELVLRNLIGNAIKHHTGAGGTVWVRAVEQGEMMEFSVRDNGPGIDPRYHARIFEMFQTLQPRDQTEGSGMGLAIVKKLVESYGGEIRVDSALGKGATFCFTWPRGV